MKSSDFYSAVVTMPEPLVGVASREIQYMSSGTYNTVSKFQSFLISLSQTFNRHSLTLEHLTSFILSILAKSSRTSQYCILCRSSACAHVRGSWSPESWTIRICDDSLSRKYFWHGSLASSFISIASIKYICCSDGANFVQPSQIVSSLLAFYERQCLGFMILCPANHRCKKTLTPRMKNAKKTRFYEKIRKR